MDKHEEETMNPTWICDCQIEGKLSPEDQIVHDSVAHKIRDFESFPDSIKFEFVKTNPKGR